MLREGGRYPARQPERRGQRRPCRGTRGLYARGAERSEPRCRRSRARSQQGVRAGTEDFPRRAFNGAVNLDYRVQDEGAFLCARSRRRGFSRFSVRGGARAGFVRERHPEGRRGPHFPSDAHGDAAAARSSGDDAVRFIFDVECTASDTIFAYFDVEEYRADATLNGRWEGTLDEWDLRMSGSCGNLSYHGAFVPAGAVKLAVEKNSGLHGSVRSRRAGVQRSARRNSREFPSRSIFEELSGTIKRLTCRGRISAAAITADIETRRHGRHGEIQGVHARRARGKVGRRGRVHRSYRRQPRARFDDIQFHSRAGAAYVNGASDFLEDRRGAVRVRTARARSGQSRRAPGDTARGKARGAILCSGSYDRSRSRIDIAVEGGRIDTFAIDTLRMRADLRERAYPSIDSLRHRLSFRLSHPRRARSPGCPIRELIASDRRRAQARERGDRVLVQESRSGSAPVARRDTRSFRRGRLNGSISMSDSLAHPLVSFSGRIDGSCVSSFRIPSVDCDVKIDRGGLAVGRDSARLAGARGLVPRSDAARAGAIPLFARSLAPRLVRARPARGGSRGSFRRDGSRRWSGRPLLGAARRDRNDRLAASLRRCGKLQGRELPALGNGGEVQPGQREGPPRGHARHDSPSSPAARGRRARSAARDGSVEGMEARRNTASRARRTSSCSRASPISSRS